MRTYHQSECFASIFAVGVTDAAKGKILPFGSSHNIGLFQDSLQIVVSGQNVHLPSIVTDVLFDWRCYG